MSVLYVVLLDLHVRFASTCVRPRMHTNRYENLKLEQHRRLGSQASNASLSYTH